METYEGRSGDTTPTAATPAVVEQGWEMELTPPYRMSLRGHPSHQRTVHADGSSPLSIPGGGCRAE
jgi:hypothetical protein